MKKDSIAKLQVTKSQIRRMAAKQRLTVGLDLGDRSSRYCILNEAGEKASEDQLPTTKAGLDGLFGKMAPCRIALEVGTHSPWVSRQLAAMGHEVIVANPRKVRLITQSVKKNDRMDAEQLARLARVDPQLLAPIRHRGVEAQGDLAVIRARAELVDCRTALINTARGLAKPMGERLKSCDADSVKESLAEGLSEATQNAIRPLLKSVEEITKQIGAYDKKIQEIGKRYPETKVLKQVHGVGTLIALTFILTLEDAERFARSREVGPYLGLTRKLRDSGESQPELGISKAGDMLMRRLLVQAAHCILRDGAPESDLKQWGMTKVQAGSGKKGSKRRKKKAAVAVARKLAVLLHKLWVTGEVYDPQYNRKAVEAAKGKEKTAAA
ncbi:MAG TPA: IS110 family transposase [Candidatus Acidoferrum sp.]|jgi:transposase|nr:IS110 family transposase [Candidatus Acidoferrum sp.]